MSAAVEVTAVRSDPAVLEIFVVGGVARAVLKFATLHSASRWEKLSASTDIGVGGASLREVMRRLTFTDESERSLRRPGRRERGLRGADGRGRRQRCWKGCG